MSSIAAARPTPLVVDGTAGVAGDGLVVRALSRADVRAVAAIERDRHQLDPWSTEAFHEVVDRGPERYESRVVTAAGSTQVLAYGVVSLAADVADLDNLTVSRASEGRGIGRALLGHLLELSMARGATEMLLEVRDDNVRAIGLYRAAGFVEINRRAGYYAPGADAIVMRRVLRRPGREGSDA